MAKHYITIKFKIIDMWFDYEQKLIHVIMELGNELVLLERNF